MIAILTGKLVSIGEHDATILTSGGIGYQFQATSRSLANLSIGEEARVFIDTQIRDDKIILTGFANETERDAFRLLQTVQGVGSKAAIALLSALSVNDLLLAISSADKAMLTRAEGIGPKVAQRVINELADKVGSISLGASGKIARTTTEEASGDDEETRALFNDAVSGLVNLGYGRSEAHAAVALIIRESKAPTLENVLPQALKELGR